MVRTCLLHEVVVCIMGSDLGFSVLFQVDMLKGGSEQSSVVPGWVELHWGIMGKATAGGNVSPLSVFY